MDMLRIVSEVMAAYGMYAFGLGYLIVRYSNRDRIPMIIATLLLPFMGVLALLVVSFETVTGQLPKITAPPRNLMYAERLSDFHRRRMFGGSVEEPRITVRWMELYEAVVERQTEQVKRIAAKTRDFLYSAA